MPEVESVSSLPSFVWIRVLPSRVDDVSVRTMLRLSHKRTKIAPFPVFVAVRAAPRIVQPPAGIPLTFFALPLPHSLALDASCRSAQVVQQHGVTLLLPPLHRALFYALCTPCYESRPGPRRHCCPPVAALPAVHLVATGRGSLRADRSTMDRGRVGGLVLTVLMSSAEVNDSLDTSLLVDEVSPTLPFLLPRLPPPPALRRCCRPPGGLAACGFRLPALGLAFGLSERPSFPRPCQEASNRALWAPVNCVWSVSLSKTLGPERRSPREAPSSSAWSSCGPG